MRKNFGAQSWLYPMPVLIIGTYDEAGNPNVMNAAWGGIHDTNQVGVCIDPGHKTADNIRRNGCFTVSFGDAAHVVQCDYVGLVSGNDVPDKVAKAGFTPVRSEFVNAPLFAELPVAVECRLVSYDPDSGCTVGEIVNISADEAVIREDGNIDPARFSPICFDPVNHTYIKLGEVAGYAFQDGLQLKK